MSLVLDSSATLPWIYADETTPAIQQVFDQVSKRGAWVPGLWKLDVANILETGVRRGRQGAAFRDATQAKQKDSSCWVLDNVNLCYCEICAISQ
ncbi:MAG: type II toxin-antitoxin system VapC family toxin [Bryobacteraceae bacterium]